MNNDAIYFKKSYNLLYNLCITFWVLNLQEFFKIRIMTPFIKNDKSCMNDISLNKEQKDKKSQTFSERKDCLF